MAQPMSTEERYKEKRLEVSEVAVLVEYLE